MLLLQRELAHDLWAEILPLLHEHKEEISHYPDIALDPDIEAYNQIEAKGGLRCYTARLNGELIGYSINFIRHNLHYQGSYQAVQDVLFVMQAHRHGRVGVALIRYKEQQLQAEQAQVTYEHTKANVQIREALAALVHRTDVGALMEKMGYELIDLIYGKRLDRLPEVTYRPMVPSDSRNPFIDEAIDMMGKRLDR
jgi:GNAT superfamily N-acetyltransferase